MEPLFQRLPFIMTGNLCIAREERLTAWWLGSREEKMPLIFTDFLHFPFLYLDRLLACGVVPLTARVGLTLSVNALIDTPRSVLYHAPRYF